MLCRNKTKRLSLFVGDSDLLLLFSHVGTQVELLTNLQPCGRQGKGHCVYALRDFFSCFLLVKECCQLIPKQQHSGKQQAYNERNPLRLADGGQVGAIVPQNRAGAEHQQQER